MDYPINRKLRISELVVSFSSEDVGHVIVGSDDWEIGDYSDEWISAENESTWEDYIPEPVIERRWQWILHYEGYSSESPYMTDKYADANEYSDEGYVKTDKYIDVNVSDIV